MVLLPCILGFIRRECVYLPKTLRLENARLTFLHWLLVSAFAAVFWSIYARRPEWNLREDVSSNMQFSYWQMDTFENESQWSVDVCQNTSRWDYWYSDIWKYENWQCMPMCHMNMSEAFTGFTETCAHPAYLLQRIDPNTVMVHTSLQDETAGPNPPYPNSSNWFIPTVYETTLGLEYWFSFRTYSHIHFTWDDHVGYSSNSIRTVVVQGARGSTNVRAIWPPGKIAITVRELLELSGSPNEFDNVQPLAGANQLEGAYLQDGPIGWISGLEMMLQIYCANVGVEGFDDLEPYDGHTCFLYVYLTENMWITRETVTALDAHGTVIFYKWSGLRIKVRLLAYWDVYDLGELASTLRDFVIWMGFTTMIMSLFLSRCLGLMSDIFSEALHREFDLRTEIAGSAARLVASSVPFVELVNSASNIPKARLSQRLKLLLSRQASYLDSAEVELLCDWCFKAIINDLDDIGETGGRAGDRSGHITCDEFIRAVANNEEVQLVDVASLFDIERKISWLEWFFMPMYLREWQHEVRALHKLQKKAYGKDHHGRRRNQQPDPEDLMRFADPTASTQLAARNVDAIMRKHPSIADEAFNRAAHVLTEKSPAWMLWQGNGEVQLQTLEEKKAMILFLVREVGEVAMWEREQNKAMRKLIEACEGFEGSFMTFIRRVFALTLSSFMAETKLVRDRIALKRNRLDFLQTLLPSLQNTKKEGDAEGASIASRIFPLRSRNASRVGTPIQAPPMVQGRSSTSGGRQQQQQQQQQQQLGLQPAALDHGQPRTPSAWNSSHSQAQSAKPQSRRSIEEAVAFEGEWFSAMPASSSERFSS